MSVERIMRPGHRPARVFWSRAQRTAVLAGAAAGLLLVVAATIAAAVLL